MTENGSHLVLDDNARAGLLQELFADVTSAHISGLKDVHNSPLLTFAMAAAAQIEIALTAAQTQQRICLALVVLPSTLRPDVDLTKGTLPSNKMRRVIDFIEAHIGQSIRLVDLAAAAAVSPFHFHRQFKKSTGLTPSQYVIQMRIKFARALLVQTDLPLVEVASRVGFADQSQFTTTFRRVTSVTPKAYR